MDVIEVAETIKEAQETMQYRNHLLSRPQLPMPLKSDMICSPAEVKYLTLHLLPNIDQLYAQLRGAKVFTTLDLRSGYYHIKLGKDS